MITPHREEHLEHSLGERVAVRANGIWTVTDGRVRRLFCLRSGRLVFAASNIIEEQFEEHCVREGWLAAGDRVKAKMESVRAGCPPHEWLVREGVVAAERFEEWVRDHALGLLDTAFDAKKPECRFDEGVANLEGKPTTDLDLAPWLLEKLRSFPRSAQAVRIRIGKPGMRPERVEKAARRLQPALEADPSAREMWDRCDGAQPVESVARACSAGEEAGLRALYGLVLLGGLRASREEAVTTAQGAMAAPVTRPELEARLERATGATHYEILEIMPDAERDRIVEAYYTLARRYHPDKFRHGEMVDLLPRIEDFFAKVTEAHQTLTNADARASYDESLTDAARAGAKEEPEHDAGYLARQNFLRARALIHRGQYQQALTFLENAIEQQENVPEYHLELGRVLTRNPRRREEAEHHLRRAIELDPTVAVSHVALADFLIRRERAEDAVHVLNEGLKWAPGNTELTKRLEELKPRKGRGLFGR